MEMNPHSSEVRKDIGQQIYNALQPAPRPPSAPAPHRPPPPVRITPPFGHPRAAPPPQASPERPEYTKARQPRGFSI